MFDAAPLQARCFCRNPACRKKLPRPVADKRDAFCDAQCQFRYSQFNCPVCDRPLHKSDRQKRKRFCSEKCKSAYHRDPARFERPFSGAARGVAGATRSPPKSHEISTAIAHDFGDRPLRQIGGPQVHPANFLVPSDSVAHTRTAKRGAIIGRRDWPIDLVGGRASGADDRLNPRLRDRILAAELPTLENYGA
jgi:YHS domain-containing protein